MRLPWRAPAIPSAAFPIFSVLLSAKPHKYETNGELSVVIASFAEKQILCRLQKCIFQKWGNSNCN